MSSHAVPFWLFLVWRSPEWPGRPPKAVEQEIGEELPEDRKDNSGDVDDTDSDSDE